MNRATGAGFTDPERGDAETQSVYLGSVVSTNSDFSFVRLQWPTSASPRLRASVTAKRHRVEQ
jgi:hypothetical protein